MIKAELHDQELINRLAEIEKDGMTVFSLEGGLLRGAVYNGTTMVNQMRANHRTGILETLVLGQAELCAALMIPLMKGREHSTFRYETDGAAKGFSVEADSSGYVRGCLLGSDVIPVGKPLDSWDLAPFFGNGTVTVTRFGEGMKTPQTGTTEIKYRNIAQDLTWYFAQSEQTNTAFITGIQFDTKGRVVGAGGLFLQVVPGAGGRKNSTGTAGRSAQTEDSGREDDDSLIEKAEQVVNVAPSLGTWFSQKHTRLDLITGLFRGMHPAVLIERDVVFSCPCSAESFAAQIKQLGKKEIDDIMAHEHDPFEVVCHNCGSVYHISKDMLK